MPNIMENDDDGPKPQAEKTVDEHPSAAFISDQLEKLDPDSGLDYVRNANGNEVDRGEQLHRFFHGAVLFS